MSHESSCASRRFRGRCRGEGRCAERAFSIAVILPDADDPFRSRCNGAGRTTMMKQRALRSSESPGLMSERRAAAPREIDRDLARPSPTPPPPSYQLCRAFCTSRPALEITDGYLHIRHIRWWEESRLGIRAVGELLKAVCSPIGGELDASWRSPRSSLGSPKTWNLAGPVWLALYRCFPPPTRCPEAWCPKFPGRLETGGPRPCPSIRTG